MVVALAIELDASFMQGYWISYGEIAGLVYSREGLLMLETDVSTTCVEVIFRVK